MNNLINLADHEKIMSDAYTKANDINTGVACPDCCCELIYDGTERIIGEGNPKRKIKCQDCSFCGYITV